MGNLNISYANKIDILTNKVTLAQTKFYLKFSNLFLERLQLKHF